MKTWLKIAPWIAAVVVAEVGSAWWMSPEPPPGTEVLELSPPTARDNWVQRPELVSEVRGSLRCDSGWIADDGGAGRIRLSFFRWDGSTTANTLEAFKHLPEQCMGTLGMKLEEIHPARIIETPGGRLVFDSTRFRAPSGGPAVHIFKCVWVSGFENTSLRDDALLGQTGNELRQLRLAAAAARFRPPHARVLMGGVTGMPTEDLAWNAFHTEIENRLTWSPPG